jgi:hypothetical protein
MGAALIRFCSPGDPPIHEVSPTLGIVAPPRHILSTGYVAFLLLASQESRYFQSETMPRKKLSREG